MTPEEIVSTVDAALRKVFSDEKSFGRGGERTHTWASGWRPCSRAMALDLLHPEDAEFDEQSYARMAFGDVFEVAVRTRLEQGGLYPGSRFTVQAQQERFQLRGQAGAGEAAGQVVITGKIDGKVRFEGGPAVPFECKAGESVKRIHDLEGLLRSPWASRYLYQLLVYLLGTGSPLGLFVLHSGAIPTLIPVLLEEHLDRAEQFLSAAETAWRCKHVGAPLPLFTSNPEHCLRCDHRGKSCAPPWYSGEGPYVSDSEELAEMVETVLEHDEAAKAHASAKKRLGDLCRGKELVLIKEHTLVGRPWGKGWRTEIQKEGEDDG